MISVNMTAFTTECQDVSNYGNWERCQRHDMHVNLDLVVHKVSWLYHSFGLLLQKKPNDEMKQILLQPVLYGLCSEQCCHIDAAMPT